MQQTIRVRGPWSRVHGLWSLLFLSSVLRASFLFALASCPLLVSAQAPSLINYQGRLTDGTNVVNGTVGLSLRLFNVPGGGSTIYEDSNEVTVVDGQYAAHLGDDTTAGALADALTNQQVWLEVAVNGVPLAPRERVAAVAYALTAGQALSVPAGSISTAQLADGAVSAANLATGSVSAIHLADGAVTSNALAPGAVAPANLAKTYQSGQLSFSDPLFVAETNFAVAFAPAFADPPVVTLSLLTTASTLAAAGGARVQSVSATGFTGTVAATLRPRVVDDDDLPVGRYTSILEVGGKPLIAYLDALGTVRIVRGRDAAGTDWVGPNIVDTNGTMGTSAAVVGGNPALAYHVYRNFASPTNYLRYVRSSTADGAAWGGAVTLASTSTSLVAQASCDLAIVGGRPAVAFYDQTSNALRYVRALDANGAVWGTPVTVVAGDVGRYVSMALAGGNPAIAYYNVNSFDAMFVRANDATGGTWNAPVTVYATGLSGQHVSMAEVAGRPAMSFYSDTAGLGLMFARANDPTGGAWSVIGVDTQTFESVGLYSSLAVVDGVPAISYYSLTAGDLKYVRAANASGTVWNAGVTVDALGNQGQYCALTSVTGRPGISYYDADNGHLRFVTDLNEPFAIQWIAVEP